MIKNISRPIIFAGPSLEVDANCFGEHRIEYKPPIKRGDIEQILTEKSTPGTIVILDGLYGSQLAISPAECHHAIQAGWSLIGGCSMGALRASELWSVGMIGLGDIYNLFRVGLIRSDADVAVSYHNNKELTLSIVHIRYILAKLCYQQELDAHEARQLLMLARKVVWFERFPSLLIEYWQSKYPKWNILNKIHELFAKSEYHPKKRDGNYIFSVLTSLWPFSI